MNLFSNIGFTELLLILLLALLVVGPERLPELARTVGKTLRDFRKVYENLTSDLGPELISLQKATSELRESVESVRSIPKDVVKSVVRAGELDATMAELKKDQELFKEVEQRLTDTGKALRDPLDAAVKSAHDALAETDSGGTAVIQAREGAGEELRAEQTDE